MARNNKPSGGFNKVLTFIGIVDDDRSQPASGQSFNSGSGYGQREAYAPSSRQHSASRSAGRDTARRSIPAQAGRSNTGSRRSYDDDPRHSDSRRSSRFAEEPQRNSAPQQRSRSRFEEEDAAYQPDHSQAPARSAAPRSALRNSGHTVTCTLYTLTDVNPVIKALIRGDTIYMNLHAPNDELRILDTLSGAAFALDAQFKKPSKEFKTYILAPQSVNIQNIMDLDD